MSEKRGSTSQQEVNKYERIHMERVLKRNEDVLGRYKLEALVDGNGNNLGYVLRNRNNPPRDGVWGLSDFDDLLAGQQETKLERLKRYSRLLQQKGVILHSEQIEEVMKKTDDFARWRDTPGGSEACYHPIAHMAALHEVTQVLLTPSQNGNDQPTALQTAYAKLERIKTELRENVEPEVDDPFLFKYGRQFFIRQTPPWSNEIQEIFLDTMLHAPRYKKNIQAISEIRSPRDGGETAESLTDQIMTGIFTSGVPSFQLDKIAQLLRENSSLNPDVLLFSQVSKKACLKRFIEHYGIRNSKFLVYDDSEDNLKGLNSLNNESQNTGNTIVCIRGITPYAKDRNAPSDFTTLDHALKTADEIIATLRHALIDV